MIERLNHAIQDTLALSGPINYEAYLLEAAPILEWIGYFESLDSNHCIGLLDATRALIAEAGACIVIGYARPAISLIRAEMDTMLSWLYYVDHPREWRYVNVMPDGFKLKSELLKLFETTEPAFKRRFSILKSVKNRREEDPYRMLSAHIHLQSEVMLPSLESLSDAVQAALLPQIVEIQREVSEYIGDVCASMFASDWIALPDFLTSGLRTRFQTAAQYDEFARPI